MEVWMTWMASWVEVWTEYMGMGIGVVMEREGAKMELVKEMEMEMAKVKVKVKAIGMEIVVAMKEKAMDLVTLSAYLISNGWTGRKKL
jgi:hypothetical protein